MDKYEKSIAGGDTTPVFENISGDMPLREFVIYYLLERDHSLSFSRYASFKTFEKNVFPMLGDWTIADIKDDDITDLKNKLFETLEHNSVWSILRKLRQEFDLAVNMGLLDDNPCKLMAEFHFEPVEKMSFTASEVECIFEAVKFADIHVRDMYRLCFACGIKRSEMLALRWGDVDFEHGIINIHNVVSDIRYSEKHKDISYKQIRYYMTDEMRSILEKRKRCQFDLNGNIDCLGEQYVSDSFVFCGDDGELLKYRIVERSNRIVKDKSGVEDFSFRRITTHVQLMRQISHRNVLRAQAGPAG